MAVNPGIQPSASRQRDNLALAFQEILTAGERLRSGRQSVSDAGQFRLNMIEGLKLAGDQARQRGYAGDDVKLAVFAVVAFIDESVLNLRSPAFADWPRRPLQEELFGHHVAGEIFFKNLQDLMARGDSEELADLLEVYWLCLTLGFAGRYSLGAQGELHVIGAAVADKIRRVRGAGSDLSPAWALPPDPPRQVKADPLVKALMIAAGGLGILAVLLFVAYKIVLGSGVSTLADLAAAIRL